MKRSRGMRMKGLLRGLCVGFVIGALAVLQLDEEPRKRLEYTISELKEMPFRIFI